MPKEHKVPLNLGQPANLDKLVKIMREISEDRLTELSKLSFAKLCFSKTQQNLDEAYANFADAGFDTSFTVHCIFKALGRHVRKSLEKQGFKYDRKCGRWFRNKKTSGAR